MDTQRVLEAVERLQARLKERGDLPTEEKLSLLKSVLQSPLFHQILLLQEADQQNQHSQRSRGLTQQGGKLPRSQSMKDSAMGSAPPKLGQKYCSRSGSLDSPAFSADTGSEDQWDFAVRSLAQGRYVLTVELLKGSAGLGFSVVALTMGDKAGLGIFLEEIQPGGVAYRDGHLKQADQILAVNGQLFGPAVTQQQAVKVLQNVVGRVRLTVARGPIPHLSNPPMTRTVSLPKNLSDLSAPNSPHHIQMIELENDGTGLGFGIVGGKTTGIMVKTILPGGVADRDNRLRSGDVILRIGNTDLTGMGSEQVAQVLKQAGPRVRLLIGRDDKGSNPSHLVTQQQEPGTDQVSGDREKALRFCEAADKHFDVEFSKNAQGLGITLSRSAGDLGSDSCSFVVESIEKGSAADLGGQVHIGDHVLSVDGCSLQGCSEQQAVELLSQTGCTVELKLLRKALRCGAPSPVSPPLPSLAEQGTAPAGGTGTLEQRRDVNFNTECGVLLTETEAEELQRQWQRCLSSGYQIMVVQVQKFSESSGLGVSLEFSDGHHYICSMLPEGPLGQSGYIQCGDELLEVNGCSVIGETHKEVVNLLKELPVNVCVVCCRRVPPQQNRNDDEEDEDEEDLHLSLKELLSEFTEKPEQNGVGVASKEAENCGKTQGPRAMWETDIQVYELVKGEAGLGFSILDYQDPEDPQRTVIVVRSLVPAGLAERDGRLLPGDRLMFVNGTDLRHASLEHAVQVLKSTAYGTIRIGVAKPLPFECNDLDLLTVRSCEVQHPSTENDTEKYAALTSQSNGRKEEDLKGHLGNMEATGKRLTSSPPSSFQRTITIVRGNTSLGMTVSAIQDGSGMIIRSVVSGGSVSQDGRLCVGDGIVAVNGEPTANLSNAQARAMLRRHSLIGPTISVTYVPAGLLEKYRAALNQLEQEDTPASSQEKPVETSRWREICKMDIEAEIKEEEEEAGAAEEEKEDDGEMGRGGKENGESEGIEKVDGVTDTGAMENYSSGNMWSQPRRVTLVRQSGTSLGISIMGGRGMGSRLNNGEMKRGIFIKNITEDSPAGRNNTLKPGDRILEVAGVDVRDASHEEVVEMIRQAGDSVEFLLQSASHTVTDGKEASSKMHTLSHGQGCESQSSLLLYLSPNNPFTPTPFKVLQEWASSDRVLKKPPRPSRLPPLSSGSEETECSHTQTHTHTETHIHTHTAQNNPETSTTLFNVRKSSNEELDASWERMLQRYSSLPGELHLIELVKGGSDLGLCLAGNSEDSRSHINVYVATIQPGGAAAADGRIQVGDELLEINGQIMYGRSHQNATSIINSAPSKVRIILTRNREAMKHMAAQPALESGISPITSPSSVDMSIVKEDQPMKFTRSSSHSPAPAPPSPLAYHTPPVSLDEVTYWPPPPCPVNSDPLACPISPGCVTTIELCKGHTGLGLSIVGGCNTVLGVILIHEVNEGGAAHRDGRLCAGDQILEVNGIDLRMATHEEALSVLRLSPQRVQLCVYRQLGGAAHAHTHPHDELCPYRGRVSYMPQDLWDLFTVEIKPCPDQGLGLSVVGKRDDTGIFVSELMRGGVAELDGRLLLGDQILSVNGEDIRAETEESARSLLQVQSRGESVVLEVARYRATPHQQLDSQVGNSDPFSHTPVSSSDYGSAQGDSRSSHSLDECPERKTVILQKHGVSDSLGISVSGGAGSLHGSHIYISWIDPSGLAAQTHQLNVGDRIVNIDGTPTEGMSHAQVGHLLKNAFGTITLQVISAVAESKSGQMKDQTCVCPTSPGQNHLRPSISHTVLPVPSELLLDADVTTSTQLCNSTCMNSYSVLY
ncbi:multiple PDZ domain protein isoform X2 [Denticeps clupeoides]|uniref:multiple PDZ domain protein isoform X2 n=1 Tax=Denticeps clupeoides TaxID=299321 RepID=UPI0010A4FEFA|nr:multiple PDZ domain protein-like isoform X2 [Denticeps clupeoides]